MNQTRRVLLTILAAAALTGASIQPAVADTGPTATIACKKAKIQGKTKCIAAGQYCARAAEKDYRRYGFTCNKRDRNGRYHLQYR